MCVAAGLMNSQVLEAAHVQRHNSGHTTLQPCWLCRGLPPPAASNMPLATNHSEQTTQQLIRHITYHQATVQTRQTPLTQQQAARCSHSSDVQVWRCSRRHNMYPPPFPPPSPISRQRTAASLVMSKADSATDVMTCNIATNNGRQTTQQ
jgi:hypothetical protein